MTKASWSAASALEEGVVQVAGIEFHRRIGRVHGTACNVPCALVLYGFHIDLEACCFAHGLDPFREILAYLVVVVRFVGGQGVVEPGVEDSAGAMQSALFPQVLRFRPAEGPRVQHLVPLSRVSMLETLFDDQVTTLSPNLLSRVVLTSL